MPDPLKPNPFEDRVEIEDVLYRYAEALDRRDWDLLGEVFTADAVAEYSGIGRTAEGLAQIVEVVSTALANVDVSHHVISNPRIELDGDSASSRCYLRAQHRTDRPQAGDPFYEVGGVYHDRLVRTEAGWRIAQRRLEVTWSQGNAGARVRG